MRNSATGPSTTTTTLSSSLTLAPLRPSLSQNKNTLGLRPRRTRRHRRLRCPWPPAGPSQAPPARAEAGELSDPNSAPRTRGPEVEVQLRLEPRQGVSVRRKGGRQKRVFLCEPSAYRRERVSARWRRRRERRRCCRGRCRRSRPLPRRLPPKRLAPRPGRAARAEACLPGNGEDPG